MMPHQQAKYALPGGWGSALGIVPPVRFPVRARAWVAGQVPGWGCTRGKGPMFRSLSLSTSLPLSLKINK